MFGSIPNPYGTTVPVPGYKIIFWPALPLTPIVGAAIPAVLNEIRLLVPFVNESVEPTESVDDNVVAPVTARVVEITNDPVKVTAPLIADAVVEEKANKENPPDTSSNEHVNPEMYIPVFPDGAII